MVNFLLLFEIFFVEDSNAYYENPISHMRHGHGYVVIPGNVILILNHKSACQEPKQPQHCGTLV